MNEAAYEMVTDGVLKIANNKKGPTCIEYDGILYYRFMDYFYTQTENLDELSPEGVSNLCRARAKFPLLISPINISVRLLFKALAQKIRPTTLLEIGAGRDPVFEAETLNGMHYVLSDADRDVVTAHSVLDTECYTFSEQVCELPIKESYFEMVIAVFVLHFPFHKIQMLELHRRLKPSGVIVANVYRRSIEARNKLTLEMEDSGFKILKIKDTKNLCRDHEYWILGKSDAQMQYCALTLKELIEDQKL